MAAAKFCRRHGMSSATFYKWKAKRGGMDVSDACRVKTLKTQNARLKKLLADSMLDNSTLKDLLGIEAYPPSVQGKSKGDVAPTETGGRIEGHVEAWFLLKLSLSVGQRRTQNSRS